MAGFPWWVWAIAAAVLALAELHVPGSYLVWIAVGAAITAGWIASGPMGALEPQIVTFIIAGALSCGVGWFVYRGPRRLRGGSGLLNQRAEQLVGTRAVVSATIANGEGKVRVGDSQWLAEGPPLPEGANVVITAAHGARLVVREAAAGE